MPLFPGVEQAGSVWAAHVASFGKLYEFHSLKTGSPGDFAQLGPKLASSEGFRLDFSDLVRTVRDREGGRLSAGEMLTIVGLAVGGPGIAAAEMELVDASGLVQVMLAGVGGWRDPWGDRGSGVEAGDGRALDEGANWSEDLDAGRPTPMGVGGVERDLPVGGRADGRGGEGDVSPEMRETLARLELANVQLRIYLDDIDRRIGRIEPNLDDLRAVVRSSGELLHGGGAAARVDGAAERPGIGGEEVRWRADEALAVAGMRERPVVGFEPEIAAAEVDEPWAGEVAIAEEAARVPGSAWTTRDGSGEVEDGVVSLGEMVEEPEVEAQLDGPMSAVEVSARPPAAPAPPPAAPASAAPEPLVMGRVRESSGAAAWAGAAAAVRQEADPGRSGLEERRGGGENGSFGERRRSREAKALVGVVAPAAAAEFAPAPEVVRREAAKGRGGWVWGASAAAIVLLAGAGAYVYRQTPQKDGGGRAVQAAGQAEALGPGDVGSGLNEAATTAGGSGGAGVREPAGGDKGMKVGRAPVARRLDEPRPGPVGKEGGAAQPVSDGSKSLKQAEARPSVMPPGTSSGEDGKVNVAAVTVGAVSRDRVEGAREAEVVRAPRVEDLQPAAAVGAGAGGGAAAPVERAATVVRAAAIAPVPAREGSGGGDVSRAPAGRVGLSVVSTGGTLLSAPAPSYPAQARQLGAEGKVVVRATVNGEGLVTGVQVVDGPGLFRQSAEDAVRRRRYAPFLVGGTPTPFQTVVTLIYRRDH